MEGEREMRWMNFTHHVDQVMNVGHNAYKTSLHVYAQMQVGIDTCARHTTYIQNTLNTRYSTVQAHTHTHRHTCLKLKAYTH